MLKLSVLSPAFLFALSIGSAQTLIIPQIADGGGWQTTLVLTNTSTAAATANLTFFQSISGGGTTNWVPPFLETSTPQSVSVPAASTVFLHTPGTATTLSEGWVQVQAGSAIVAYAIFTQTVPGRTNQDGTALAATSTGRVLMPFDNTIGFVTSLAITNPTSTGESITVAVQPVNGSAAQLSPITLPANGYLAFTLPQQFPSTLSQSGLLEFYTSTGSLSLIALRFNPSGGFTASPVYCGNRRTNSGRGVPRQWVYTGTYISSVQSGAVTVTVSNGTVTVGQPAAGSGTVTATGQVTFGHGCRRRRNLFLHWKLRRQRQRGYGNRDVFLHGQHRRNLERHAPIAPTLSNCRGFGDLTPSMPEFLPRGSEWPASRLVDTWNSFAGVAPFDDLKPVKKFTSRSWPSPASGRRCNAWRPTPRNRRATSRPRGPGGRRSPGKTPRAAPVPRRARTRAHVNKKAEVIAMMRRAKGVTLAEIMETSGGRTTRFAASSPSWAVRPG